MVEIMLYKLLNIPVGIAAVLGGDAVQPGLQAGAEMYFHSLENRNFQDYCQYGTASMAGMGMAGLGVLEQRHEAEIHVQLLMTVK